MTIARLMTEKSSPIEASNTVIDTRIDESVLFSQRERAPCQF